MRKAKRITAAVMAAAMMLMSAPITANAATSEVFDAEQFKDCIKLDNEDCLEIIKEKYNAVYMRQNDDDAITLYIVDDYPDLIEFAVSKDIDEKIIENAVKGVDENLIFRCSKRAEADTYNCSIIDNDEKIDAATAKAVFKALNGYIADRFDYKSDMQMYHYGVYKYMTAYLSSEENKLNRYLEENNIKASLVMNEDSGLIYIVPDNKLTATEHFLFAKEIAQKTGITPIGEYPAISGDIIGGATIDVSDSVDGDANKDGKVTVADAVAVLQYIANAEKYPMTEQAQFNADIDGEDGITGGDATAIQRIDAGIWDES